jgi:hypothetical protein
MADPKKEEPKEWYVLSMKWYPYGRGYDPDALYGPFTLEQAKKFSSEFPQKGHYSASSGSTNFDYTRILKLTPST